MYIFLQISQTRSKGGGVCKMKDCVIISMAMGVIVGALIVSNSETSWKNEISFIIELFW